MSESEPRVVKGHMGDWNDPETEGWPATQAESLRAALVDAESRLTTALNAEPFESDPLWRLRNDLRRVLAATPVEDDEPDPVGGSRHGVES